MITLAARSEGDNDTLKYRYIQTYIRSDISGSSSLKSAGRLPTNNF